MAKSSKLRFGTPPAKKGLFFTCWFSFPPHCNSAFCDLGVRMFCHIFMFCDLGAVCFLELSWAVWMLRKVRDVYFVKIFWIVMFWFPWFFAFGCSLEDCRKEWTRKFEVMLCSTYVRIVNKSNLRCYACVYGDVFVFLLIREVCIEWYLSNRTCWVVDSVIWICALVCFVTLLIS